MVAAATPFSCWYTTDRTNDSNGLRRFFGTRLHGPTRRISCPRILSVRARCRRASSVIASAGPFLVCSTKSLYRFHMVYKPVMLKFLEPDFQLLHLGQLLARQGGRCGQMSLGRPLVRVYGDEDVHKLNLQRAQESARAQRGLLDLLPAIKSLHRAP